jgi:hypothetical protein
MIRRTLLIAVWLAIGAAVLAGLYWLFLNTPESNVLMLIASAVLVTLIVMIAAVVANVAVLLALGGTLKTSIPSGARRSGWFIVAAVPVALLIWIISMGDAWVARRSGEISAWFIAQFGWADISPLFAAHRYLSAWLRWVMLPVAALAALASLLHRGDGEPRRRWLAPAWHWRTLLMATLAFVALVVLPWQAASWQPQGLPPTWIQPTVAAIRLATVAALIALGFAIIVMTVTRHTVQVSTHAEQ